MGTAGKVMKKTIVLLPGDGIGPEVTRAGAAVLRECAHEFHHQFDFHEMPIGGAAIDRVGTHWTRAEKQTRFFWGPLEGRSGTRFRLESARKAGCCRCGRGWVCM
jgi:isocitrate/isopropylmalate dehydrogenase